MRIIYTQPASFTLNIRGECQFSVDDKRQLSPESRIGFWGCWLVFESRSSENAYLLQQSPLKRWLVKLSLPSYFITQKSLSAKQYARLCRVIIKLSNNADS
ncbi:hypothetical protein [Colwellia sp. Bg11-12]|jgi:hypothetical protein|uniref:hypothetical protein n=1 Tax=Colwellia sp. Bg11-12 TaxID=2759817 RepID=UPI0015F49810|nr:hypothetical protein [Colwellia sp. Bg11-12]MBA6264198.1 hypothetical protein [Colwellia sp. Bg11-12]